MNYRILSDTPLTVTYTYRCRLRRLQPYLLFLLGSIVPTGHKRAYKYRERTITALLIHGTSHQRAIGGIKSRFVAHVYIELHSVTTLNGFPSK